MTEAWEFQPRVDKGFKLLDERLGPEWVEKIDLRTLALQSNCSCVLAQLAIDLGSQVQSFGGVVGPLFGVSPFEGNDLAVDYGFVLPDGDNPKDYEALTKSWTRTISARRAES